MGAIECAGQLALPYGYAGAMPGVNRWAMDRGDEMVRSAVRRRPGRHLGRAVLPGTLRHAGEATYISRRPPRPQAPPDGREERVTGKKARRLKLLPKVVADVIPIIRWGIEIRLQLIEEVACGSQASGTGAPGKEDAMKRILRSLGTDWKAEEEDVVDYMRAEVREWWQDFPERQLLTSLYRRAALRRAECGSPDSRRRPDHQEGLRIATPLLADIPNTDRFDSEWEFEAVSEVLAALLLPPIGVRSPGAMREYIERSEASRAYFGALERMAEKLDSRREVIPGPLDMWRAKAAGGLRRRPARRSVPSHRPVNPAHLLRDLQIQFTIAVLQRVGVKPRGHVSGCYIVSEALEFSKGNVSLSRCSSAKAGCRRLRRPWPG